jgi:hypothetical protein
MVGDAQNGGRPTNVQVRGNWGSDAVHGAEVRTGLYDAETGMLHIGGTEGHGPLATQVGIGAKPSSKISGLEIVQKPNGIFFRVRSGWFPRPLTPAEQAAVAKALETQFGKPARHDPNLGPVIRPRARS